MSGSRVELPGLVPALSRLIVGRLHCLLGPKMSGLSLIFGSSGSPVLTTKVRRSPLSAVLDPFCVRASCVSFFPCAPAPTRDLARPTRRSCAGPSSSASSTGSCVISPATEAHYRAVDERRPLEDDDEVRKGHVCAVAEPEQGLLPSHQVRRSERRATRRSTRHTRSSTSTASSARFWLYSG